MSNTHGKSSYPAVPGAKFWFSEGVTGFDFGAGDFQLGVTETRELAEFIVKACMGYEDLRKQRDELLAAAEDAAAFLRRQEGEVAMRGTTIKWGLVLDKLYAAIANAEKGSTK